MKTEEEQKDTFTADDGNDMIIEDTTGHYGRSSEPIRGLPAVSRCRLANAWEFVENMIPMVFSIQLIESCTFSILE